MQNKLQKFIFLLAQIPFLTFPLMAAFKKNISFDGLVEKVTADCKLQMEKEANAGEVSEETKKIDELEGMLKEQDEELQAMESFQSYIINKKQETDDELEEIKGVMIEVGMVSSIELLILLIIIY